MVARWTRKRRATSAPVRPTASIPRISVFWCARSFGRRPPFRPRSRAAVRPARVRSRTMGTDLGGGVLIVGLRHAGVAKQHGRCREILLPLTAIWQQDFAQYKPLFLLVPDFRCADDRL